MIHSNFTDVSIKEILHPRYHWSYKKGFWPYSLRFFVISLGLVISFLVPLSTVNVPTLKIWLSANIFYILLLPFIPVFVYWLIFWINRTFLKLIFSKKVNVVFAYNFEVDPSFDAEYDKLIAELNRRIAEGNLGGVINIVKKPSDIEFRKKTAAEAKTKLGLPGSTLLIWGHLKIAKRRKKLVSLFSYEFGYPNFLTETYAKSVFGKNIQRAFSSGLFGIDKFDIEIIGDLFGERTIDTISFVLGMMAASFGNTEKALIFFDEFRKRYHEADPLRRREMGPAMGEVERSLKKIKVGLAGVCYENGEYDQMWQYTKDAIGIDKYDYFANMAAALYWEIMGKREESKQYTQTAENNHPSGQYDYKFNKAYFALDEGNYPEAVRLYNEIPSVIPGNPNHITAFFYEKYRATKKLPFLFGEGIVAVRWQDKKVGKRILRNFVKKAKRIDETQYQVLINEAEKAIVM